MKINEVKIDSILGIMKQVKDSHSVNPESIKSLKSMLEEYILENKKEEHKKYMESIINRIPKEKPKKDAPKLKEVLMENVVPDGFEKSIFISPLQSWIEKGKELVTEEIRNVNNYVDTLRMDIRNAKSIIESCQAQIDDCNIELNSELERVNNLRYLLETISMK